MVLLPSDRGGDPRDCARGGDHDQVHDRNFSIDWRDPNLSNHRVVREHCVAGDGGYIDQRAHGDFDLLAILREFAMRF